MSEVGAKLPAMLFFVQDWLSDERLNCTSLAAQGLWMKMLCFMWKSSPRGYLQLADKPIPEEMLYRMCGVDSIEGAKLLSELRVAGVFSTTEAGVIYSRRLTRDQHIREVRSRAGSQGAKARYKKPISDPNSQTGDSDRFAMAKAMANVEYENEYETQTIRSVDRRVSKPTEQSPRPDGLEPREHAVRVTDDQQDKALVIYNAYPRKVGKAAALKAILAALRKERFDILLEATGKFAASPAGRRGAYTPHPATWFNHERWLDDTTEWERSGDDHGTANQTRGSTNQALVRSTDDRYSAAAIRSAKEAQRPAVDGPEASGGEVGCGRPEGAAGDNGGIPY